MYNIEKSQKELLTNLLGNIWCITIWYFFNNRYWLVISVFSSFCISAHAKSLAFWSRYLTFLTFHRHSFFCTHKISNSTSNIFSTGQLDFTRLILTEPVDFRAVTHGRNLRRRKLSNRKQARVCYKVTTKKDRDKCCDADSKLWAATRSGRNLRERKLWNRR